MKKQMAEYVDYCIKFIDQVKCVIESRGVLPYLQEIPMGCRLMNPEEINNHRNICACCYRILEWLSKVNLEKDSSIFGIEDAYLFKDEMTKFSELLYKMNDYYSLSLEYKIDEEYRIKLENITNTDEFIEVFSDIKIELNEKSNEKILSAPIKEINGLNMYIEMGSNPYFCKGIENTNIRQLPEYTEFKENPSEDTLMDLMRTGEIETLYKGCIRVSDYEVFSEIAEYEVKFRGLQAHYTSWKLKLNKSKYDKITSLVDGNSFLLLYSNIDNIDGDIFCEYNGMDIEVSKTKFRNYAGIHVGTYEDKRGTYEFIVDANVD